MSHPSPEKLLKLLNSAGDPWQSDEELKKLIKKVSDECAICKIYRKTPQRPIVGLPMATSFQECIAMDLKFYKGKILLHLIDHTTRLSVSSFVKSSEPEVILKAIFKSWIQIYVAPEKFFTDNGEEFASSKFVDMAESMNITVKVRVAKSPFSNGLVERHNFIIADMMDKVLSRHGLTLAWCLNAKNSLANVHGLSTFQLVFGQNPKLPSTFTGKPPALIQHILVQFLQIN